MLTIVGWGKVDNWVPSQEVPKFPSKADVLQVDPRMCHEMYEPADIYIIEPAIVCIDGPDRRATCNGDSGGPHFLTNLHGKLVNVGITSFGRECGQINYPTVNTKVHYYLDWIQSNIPSDSKLCLATEKLF